MDTDSNDDNDNLSPRARFAVRVSVRTRRDIICYYFILIVSIVEVMTGDGGDRHDHESRCCCVVDDYLN